MKKIMIILCMSFTFNCLIANQGAGIPENYPPQPPKGMNGVKKA